MNRSEEQIKQNAQAIQTLVDNALNINGLPLKGSAASSTDNLMAQTTLGNTVKMPLQDIISLVNNVITVNGNPFTLVKNPDNSLLTLEVNDAVKDGFWINTIFVELMVYTGGDINTESSWNFITRHKQIPQI